MTKTVRQISGFGTIRTFLKVGTCSEALYNVLDRAFDNPLEQEEHASMFFAGGIMQHGYQCGQIWGAALGAGAQAYKLGGPGEKSEYAALIAAKKVVESFQTRNKEINCLELIDTDWRKSSQVFKYFIKGGTFKCLGMAARFAPVAFNEINDVMFRNHKEPACSPVSCAVMLMNKIGASEMHTVMVSGFAGGIGLCGGACGALGAKLWIDRFSFTGKRDMKSEFNDPKAMEIIEKFLESSDYEFECSKITGRKFESPENHSAYLNEGGCSKLIEILASN